MLRGTWGVGGRVARVVGVWRGWFGFLSGYLKWGKGVMESVFILFKEILVK